MSRLTWDAIGSRTYEGGVDRGVLYVPGSDGVPWSGLTSVVERPTGGEPRPFYMDGEKYQNVSGREEFEATLSALTYPDEFGVCDGTAVVRAGLLATQQRRRSFHLSYRSLIGNDLKGLGYAYKIHLIYNALAKPSERNNVTLGDAADAADFVWELTTRAPVSAGIRRTAHLIIDSRTTNPVKLQMIEDLLYGSDILSPQIPTLEDLVVLYDDPLEFTLTDHGDGSFTIVAPNSSLEIESSGSFTFDWPTAEPVDEDTYTVASE